MLFAYITSLIISNKTRTISSWYWFYYIISGIILITPLLLEIYYHFFIFLSISYLSSWPASVGIWFLYCSIISDKICFICGGLVFSSTFKSSSTSISLTFTPYVNILSYNMSMAEFLFFFVAQQYRIYFTLK